MKIAYYRIDGPHVGRDAGRSIGELIKAAVEWNLFDEILKLGPIENWKWVEFENEFYKGAKIELANDYALVRIYE